MYVAGKAAHPWYSKGHLSSKLGNATCSWKEYREGKLNSSALLPPPPPLTYFYFYYFSCELQQLSVITMKFLKLLNATLTSEFVFQRRSYATAYILHHFAVLQLQNFRAKWNWDATAAWNQWTAESCQKKKQHQWASRAMLVKQCLDWEVWSL